MIRTRGLTHLALKVNDAEQAFAFYRDVFGVVAVYRERGFIQAQTLVLGMYSSSRSSQGLPPAREASRISAFGWWTHGTSIRRQEQSSLLADRLSSE